MNQARKPRGVPTGGQFAPTNRPGPRNLDLGDDHDAEVEDNGAGTDDHLVSTTGAHLSELGRDERIAALRNEIDRAMRDLSNAKGWQAFLESRSRFHRCSLGNAFLICRQSPAATQVGGFNDWKHKHGRSVKGGERAIWILAPITRTVEVVGDDGGDELGEPRRRVPGGAGVRREPDRGSAAARGTVICKVLVGSRVDRA